MVRKSVPHLAVLGLMGMLVQPALGAVHGEAAGTEHGAFLRQIASHGYVVIALDELRIDPAPTITLRTGRGSNARLELRLRPLAASQLASMGTAP